MQAPGPGHGGQGQPFTTDVAEDLKNHEAEQEEIETGTDACNDDECHLRQQQSRINQRLNKHKNHATVLILCTETRFEASQC